MAFYERMFGFAEIPDDQRFGDGGRVSATGRARPESRSRVDSGGGLATIANDAR